MHEADLINIGKRIQQRRKQLALTQEQVAEMMNVSVQMISNLERGNKGLKHRIFHAMCAHEIDGFKECGRYPDAGNIDD